ncbi:MAG TPA: M48 family metallopeptidase [Gammaproteobacteria bacterium]|nr:M48 family metallopeptidase [Gammaproteobacteria bacterium]
MSDRSFSLQGYYYDGRQPLRQSARLEFMAGEATLVLNEADRRYRTSGVLVSPRIGYADRFIALPDGSQFQCADDPTLDLLPQHSRTEHAAAWLEQRIGVAIASVFLIVTLLAGGYEYGLPAAANRIAAGIPIDTEQTLGGQALAWLDDSNWFQASRLDQDVRDRIRWKFEGLCAELPFNRYYQLEFRDSVYIGANAFALPGGTIVITDDMVNLAESDDEVLAILAHEIGHVEYRHVMRQALQSSVVAAAAATITGDAATLGVAVAGFPSVVAQTEYSRDFETEADDFAFRLLHEHDMSPEVFATVMERIEADCGCEPGVLDFLSTHPVTVERIDRARAAALSLENL